MDIAGVGHNPRSDLDQGPPLPPEASRRPSLQQLAGGREASMGVEAGNPQVQALEGMQLTERGIQMLAMSLPDMAPALAQLLQQLRTAVPQAMGAASQGGAGAMPMAAPPPGVMAG